MRELGKEKQKPSDTVISGRSISRMGNQRTVLFWAYCYVFGRSRNGLFCSSTYYNMHLMLMMVGGVAGWPADGLGWDGTRLAVVVIHAFCNLISDGPPLLLFPIPGLFCVCLSLFASPCPRGGVIRPSIRPQHNFPGKVNLFDTHSSTEHTMG